MRAPSRTTHNPLFANSDNAYAPDDYANDAATLPADIRPYSERNDALQSSVGKNRANRPSDIITAARNLAEIGDLSRTDKALQGRLTPTLQSAVERVQARAAMNNPDITIDGVYGPQTQGLILDEILPQARSNRARGEYSSMPDLLALNPTSTPPPPNAPPSIKDVFRIINSQIHMNLADSQAATNDVEDPKAAAQPPMARLSAEGDATQQAKDNIHGGAHDDDLTGADAENLFTAPNTNAEISQALKDASISLEAIPDTYLDDMIAGVTRENAAARIHSARRILGRTSDVGVAFARLIQTAARLGPDSLHDTTDFPRTLSAAKDHLNKAKQTAADFRNQTGFGLSVTRNNRINLLDANGRIAVTLPTEVVQGLQNNPELGTAMQAFAAAQFDGASNATAKRNAFSQLAAKAINAGHATHHTGDGWIFNSVEERVEGAKKAYELLQAAKSEDARKAANAALSIVLFAEAMPGAKTLQGILDTLPGTGNLRSGEAALESLPAAYRAIKSGENVAASVLIATLDAAGALAGIYGGAKMVAKGAIKNPVTQAVIASRKIGTALEQGATPLPARPLKGEVDPQVWNSLTKLQQKNAAVLYGHAKGEAGEAHIDTLNRKLGMRSSQGKNDTSRKSFNIEVPGVEETERRYDGLYIGKKLTNVRGYAVPTFSKGRKIASEVKVDGSAYDGDQKYYDDIITEHTKDARDSGSKKANPGVGHNMPPPGADILADEVKIFRIPLESIDSADVTRLFKNKILSPHGIAMKRVRNGIWDMNDLENVIDIVENAMAKYASKPKNPIYENLSVADVILGVLIRSNSKKENTISQ